SSASTPIAPGCSRTSLPTPRSSFPCRNPARSPTTAAEAGSLGGGHWAPYAHPASRQRWSAETTVEVTGLGGHSPSKPLWRVVTTMSAQWFRRSTVVSEPIASCQGLATASALIAQLPVGADDRCGSESAQFGAQQHTLLPEHLGASVRQLAGPSASGQQSQAAAQLPVLGVEVVLGQPFGAGEADGPGGHLGECAGGTGICEDLVEQSGVEAEVRDEQGRDAAVDGFEGSCRRHGDQAGPRGEEVRQRPVPQLDAVGTGSASAAEALENLDVGMLLVVGFELAWAGAHLDDGPRPVMPMCEFGQGCDDRFAVGALGGNLRLRGEHEGARGRGSGDRDRVWGARR